MFRQLLEVSQATKIRAQSNDRLLLLMLYDCGADITSDTILFEDAQRGLVSGAAAQIFRDALALGGSISAEHGLGALKRDYAELEHGVNSQATLKVRFRRVDG